jgi:magnesium transporter
MLDNEIRVEHISIIHKKSVVITFQQEKGDVFDRVRERFKVNYARIFGRGVDYILYMLMDSVVDNYLYVTGIVGEKIEEIDESTFTRIDRKMLHEINELKSGLNFLRRNVIPGRDVTTSLVKMDDDWVSAKNRPFFDDLQNNATQATDALDSFRDMMSDQLSIYHTNVSANLNDIMKFLTMFSVVFIPVTFIAGIYGTNFENIPELSNPNGYYIMLGAMLLITIILLLYFRWRKWL